MTLIPQPSMTDLVEHFQTLPTNGHQRRKARLMKSRIENIRKYKKELMKIKRSNRLAHSKHLRETRKLIENLKKARHKEFETQNADAIKEETRLHKRICSLSKVNDKVSLELSREYISRMLQNQTVRHLATYEV